MPEFDERDAAIVAERVAELDKCEGPRVGDYIRFADGVQRRVSHVWRNEDGTPFSIQSSNGGSFYLGSGYASFSGGLFPGVKPEVLTLTEETLDGSVWIFHHNRSMAHNGVDATVAFRVYTASVDAPR